MSGCYPVDKCSCLCHIVWPSHICKACECSWDSMIKQIEDTTKTYGRNLFNDRLERIEKHKNYQIDENRKTFRRMNEFDERLNYLTKLILETKENINIWRKGPFKCPVCNGLGGTISGNCHACDAKGVVWCENE